MVENQEDQFDPSRKREPGGDHPKRVVYSYTDHLSDEAKKEYEAAAEKFDQDFNMAIWWGKKSEQEPAEPENSTQVTPSLSSINHMDINARLADACWGVDGWFYDLEGCPTPNSQKPLYDKIMKGTMASLRGLTDKPIGRVMIVGTGNDMEAGTDFQRIWQEGHSHPEISVSSLESVQTMVGQIEDYKGNSLNAYAGYNLSMVRQMQDREDVQADSRRSGIYLCMHEL